MEKLKIALGRRVGFTDDGLPKLGTLTKPCKEIDWPTLVDKLMLFKETDDKGSVGFMIGGWFEGTRRIAEKLQGRTLIVLDIDYAEPWDDIEGSLRLLGWSFVAHTTWSHTADSPRYRAVIPLSRPCTKEEYQPLARKVAESFIEWVDPASFKANQLMYLPSFPEGGEPRAFSGGGGPVDVDAVLGEYEDWQDWGSWPRADAETGAAEHVFKAKNPFEAPGIIGAFNRTYNIPHAIHTFGLPYEQAEGGQGDRWMYTNGEGNAGALVYDNYGPGCFLYSNHTDDPAHGNNTAWDLVRIHQFGDLDQGYEGPIGQAPSQKAMTALAMKDPDVVAENAAEEGFEDVSESAPQVNGSEAKETDREQKAPDTQSGAESTQSGNIGALGFSDIEARLTAASALTVDMARDAVIDIAAAKLDPMQESSLVAMIAGKLDGVTKRDVERQLKAAKDAARGQIGNAEDLELLAIKQFLGEHFEDGEHIKRFAKQFWRFLTGLWFRIEDEQVRGLLQTVLFKLREEAPTNRQRALIKAALDDIGSSSAMTGKLWSMFAAHCAQLDMSRDPMHLLDDQKPVVNCVNGEVHFNRKGQFKLTKHHPELFLTTQVPLEYDPEADTTEWDEFCNILFHDSLEPEDMKRHLEEAMGYILQPWREIPTIFMLHGAPLAGKSTLLAVLEAMLGTTVVTQKFSAYGERASNSHAMAGLVGKLLLADPDYADGDQLPESFLKTVSEGGVVTCNPKNKEEFNFRVTCVPMVLTNHWPSSRDYSGALERRMVVWDFPTIPEDLRSDAARRRLLSPEGLQGALKRFVEGFARLYQRHSEAGGRQGWLIPDECLEALDTWRVHRDPVLKFFRDCVQSSEGEGMKKSEVWEAFNRWKQVTGSGGPQNQGKFTERFDDLVSYHYRSGMPRYWDIEIDTEFFEE